MRGGAGSMTAECMNQSDRPCLTDLYDLCLCLKAEQQAASCVLPAGPSFPTSWLNLCLYSYHLPALFASVKMSDHSTQMFYFTFACHVV